MNRASSRIIAACLVLCAGCASTTSVNQQWFDRARPAAPLGKTLVVALLRDPQLSAALEQEWARQLRQRGVDATAIEALGPTERPPSKQAVESLVERHGFASVVVSKTLDVKQVERDNTASQVAVVETKLYDARTGKPFWSAQTDTFVSDSSVEEVRRTGSPIIQSFVSTLIAAMFKAKLL